ncbi:MAG: DNA-directed RNA polymerase subunit omega [Oscillospiraceae bacterium]|nr:DNA-directed RNA polymerase subunit omega [Oscillospiraceae bacterium]MBR4928856.1 DNA-directed RNA polymerase subunit omega [Oscillospiraceae bacterium]MBR5045543.1 DNA-directed RNA polymerase subunit omega [Oscillospiraceae bacterium]MBR5071204.1 DNA-directed RNA polymerase subunit omega [Oscillospiraceae bacterium]MBR5979831.1 DNA-directed RNA polymerase subunit omega [Oscillospiraceae bacterium]
MLKPAIGQLLTENDSSYSLVIAVAKRARDIVKKAEEKGTSLNDKPVSLAIDEFGAHKFKVKD